MWQQIWICLTKRKLKAKVRSNITFGSLKHEYGYERQELIGWETGNSHVNYTHIYDTSARIH